jgi:hypothetical protein
MKQQYVALCSSLAIFAQCSATFGAEDQAANASSGAAWLIIMTPFVLLVVFFVVLARKSGAMKQGGYMAKAATHMDQSEAHMANMERKTDRMIELLESINRRLGE